MIFVVSEIITKFARRIINLHRNETNIITHYSTTYDGTWRFCTEHIVKTDGL